ncbi:MAG: VOC family protein [Bacteroidetes bacterium]|nr:VOC family protein [Bacteroidota bacterium]
MNLNQITIPVFDIEKSIQFYEILGLKLIVKSLPHYARFECPDGDATFSLHKVEKLSSVENSIWIYFEVKELDLFVNQLMQQKIEVEEMPNEKPWMWQEARLKDLDGNQLILYYAGDNRKNPPWRIK